VSNGAATTGIPDTTYYDYLRRTTSMARKLTERLVYMEETGLASSANLLRMQLQQMVDADLDAQLAAIPQPDFSQ